MSEKRYVPKHRRDKLGITGMGDLVAVFANPVAHGLDALLGTKLEGCAPCQRRRDALNRALPFSIPRANVDETRKS